MTVDGLPTRVNPNGACPWCGRVAHFKIEHQADLSRHPIWREHVAVAVGPSTSQISEAPLVLTRCTILNCDGCGRGVAIFEERDVDETLARASGGRVLANSGPVSVLGEWVAAGCWPVPDQASLDVAIPERVRKPFGEGLRALSASAPNAAVSTFRNALSAMVLEQGSEAAKAKREMSDKLKQFIADGGLPSALGDWADHINLYGNAGAHPEAYGEVSMSEAREVALLLRSLFDAVYVLPANIKMRRGERMPGKS